MPEKKNDTKSNNLDFTIQEHLMEWADLVNRTVKSHSIQHIEDLQS